MRRVIDSSTLILHLSLCEKHNQEGRESNEYVEKGRIKAVPSIRNEESETQRENPKGKIQNKLTSQQAKVCGLPKEQRLMEGPDGGLGVSLGLEGHHSPTWVAL